MNHTPSPSASPAKRALEDVRATTAFLTRLPINAAHFDLARACWAFPIAGLFVGGAAGAAFVIPIYLGFSPLAAALLALLAVAFLTGALHEDGLADMADGLGGSDPARRLEIMRDSRIGAFGVLALIFSVGLRATTLATIAEKGFVALIAVAILSRGLLPAMMYGLNLASDSGVAATAGKPKRAPALLSSGLAIVGVIIFLGPATGFGALIFGALAVGGVALLAKHLIGGYNGDILGAAQQTTEIAVLLFLAASL